MLAWFHTAAGSWAVVLVLRGEGEECGGRERVDLESGGLRVEVQWRSGGGVGKWRWGSGGIVADLRLTPASVATGKDTRNRRCVALRDDVCACIELETEILAQFFL